MNRRNFWKTAGWTGRNACPTRSTTREPAELLEDCRRDRQECLSYRRTQHMNRRNFLEALAVTPFLTRAAGSMAEARREPAGDPLDRIGVSTWSLHRFFAAGQTSAGRPGGPGRSSAGSGPRGQEVPESALVKLTDFFQLAFDRWGLRNFEAVNNHFDSTEQEYLGQVKRAAAAVKGRIQNIPTDIRGTNLSDDDEQKRLAAVAAVRRWMDVAAAVDAPSIRCNTGRARDENNLEPAIRSYTELAGYGQSKKVRVIIENHGGLSSDPDKVVKLIRAVNHPNLGTCPDFGNFPNDQVRFRGLEMMFPYAQICHAKSHDFDERGEMTAFDFRRCVALAEKAGFRGIYSIEYEGKADPYEGVTRTVALLKQALSGRSGA